ncbi:MAG: GTPase Era, partial [Oscillospiraceae bacterium]
MEEKTLFCAIVGKPNAGKSTLLNRLVGAKIAIVSSKPQTTRSRIMGVVTRGQTQFVYLDTPGFHSPKTKLGEHMVKSVRECVAEIDCVLFLTYPKGMLDEDEMALLNEAAKSRAPIILVINKADTLSSASKGTAIKEELCGRFAFSDSVIISALNGDGVDELERVISKYALDGPHMFPDDTLTDVPEKVIVSELIREK